MKDFKEQQSILFADIGGSSAFYNLLGDQEAKQSIDNILNSVSQIVNKHQGKTIKNIGDEVMCAFSCADQSVKAAIAMQTYLAVFLKQRRLTLNIGIGFGEVIEDKQDIFGNVVNEAAHLTSLANSGQILITQNLFKELSMDMASAAREFDQIVFKGANGSSRIYRIYWQNEARHGSETQLMTKEIREGILAESIQLKYRGKLHKIGVGETPFIIGRDSNQCNLLVSGSEISRKHCHISYSRGKFVLIDHSTNGSYLSEANKEEIYLRRETFPLSGNVSLSLGVPGEKSGDNKIELSV